MTHRAPLVMASAAKTTAATSPAKAAAVLSRKCACGNHASGGMCPECQKEERQRRVARFADRSAPPHPRSRAEETRRVPSIVHDVLRETGRHMPADVRAFMEPRFGVDFSGVRLHTDGEAARSASAVSARAYTAGSHIVFGAGQFEPATPAGRRLLAHELTHVVQQRASAGASHEPPETVSDPAEASEREADATADRVLSHTTVPEPSSSSAMRAPAGVPPAIVQPGAGVQRQLSDEEKAGIAGGVLGAIGAGFAVAWLAGAFDRQRFTTGQLIEYLNGLATRRTPEDNRDSDNKARDVVRHWQEGDARIDVNKGHRATGGSLTPVSLKRLLIRELLLGVTAGDDELAIITILERSTAEEVLQLLDPAHGVSLQQLDDKIGGDNHRRLEAVLESKVPKGSAARAQEAPQSGCTARQGIMVSYARQAAVRWVDNAIVALNRLQDTAVRQALECRFRGGTLAHRRQILEVFERTRQQLPTRQYFCGSESGPGALEATELRSSDGRLMVAECVSEDADSFVKRGGGTHPEVFLCGNFFKRDPDQQTLTIVHESVHAAGLLEDPAYQPGCGLDLATALRNPDSFAYLAADLMRLTGQVTSEAARSSLPSVSVGNFRNSGPVSDENQSPLGQEIPGLGIDANTGLNIMELRGDISGRAEGVEYEFRRTKEQAIWRKANGMWQRLRYVPPGTADDTLNRDEDLTPHNNHIYSLDGPGLPDLMAPIGPHTAGADEAVYQASFLESVEARVPPAGWTRVSNEFAWHSITWLERVDGLWERKAGKNEIEPGPLTVGMDPPEPAAAPQPPSAPAAPGSPPAAPQPAPAGEQP